MIHYNWDFLGLCPLFATLVVFQGPRKEEKQAGPLTESLLVEKQNMYIWKTNKKVPRPEYPNIYSVS